MLTKVTDFGARGVGWPLIPELLERYESEQLGWLQIEPVEIDILCVRVRWLRWWERTMRRCAGVNLKGKY